MKKLLNFYIIKFDNKNSTFLLHKPNRKVKKFLKIKLGLKFNSNYNIYFNNFLEDKSDFGNSGFENSGFEDSGSGSFKKSGGGFRNSSERRFNRDGREMEGSGYCKKRRLL